MMGGEWTHSQRRLFLPLFADLLSECPYVLCFTAEAVLLVIESLEVLTLPVQLRRAGQPRVSGKSQVCGEVSNTR